MNTFWDEIEKSQNIKCSKQHLNPGISGTILFNSIWVLKRPGTFYLSTLGFHHDHENV